jgi:lipopolysaccharide/colanic/teichoic acid biosynthesis glycosyltransferase
MPFSVALTKRLMDLFISFTVLLLASPLLILIALAIKIDSRGPVFYKQKRAKKCQSYNFLESCRPEHERDVFCLYKFRTMTVDAEANGAVNAAENDPRVTRVGKILRATRIDEIPNLFNVLVGHMSVVGPRADRIEIMEGVEDLFPYIWDRTRFVKPGITGLAQIKLRSNGTIDQSNNEELIKCLPDSDIDQEAHSFRYKLYYDFAYTLRLQRFKTFLSTDILIIIRTPIVMFFRQNDVSTGSPK